MSIHIRQQVLEYLREQSYSNQIFIPYINERDNLGKLKPIQSNHTDRTPHRIANRAQTLRSINEKQQLTEINKSNEIYLSKHYSPKTNVLRQLMATTNSHQSSDNYITAFDQQKSNEDTQARKIKRIIKQKTILSKKNRVITEPNQSISTEDNQDMQRFINFYQWNMNQADLNLNDCKKKPQLSHINIVKQRPNQSPSFGTYEPKIEATCRKSTQNIYFSSSPKFLIPKSQLPSIIINNSTQSIKNKTTILQNESNSISTLKMNKKRVQLIYNQEVDRLKKRNSLKCLESNFVETNQKKLLEILQSGKRSHKKYLEDSKNLQIIQEQME